MYKTVPVWALFYFSASNEYQSTSDELVVTVEDPEGEPIVICKDNPSLANCKMIVQANLCYAVPMYAEICCKSCTEAGATPPPPTEPPVIITTDAPQASDVESENVEEASGEAPEEVSEVTDVADE